MAFKKRIGIAVALTLIFTLSFSTTLFAAEVNPIAEKRMEVENKDNIITPRTVVSYPRTVIKLYAAVGDIPSSLPYSEYVNGYLCYGYLKVAMIDRTSDGWYRVTFSGEITGSI